MHQILTLFKSCSWDAEKNCRATWPIKGFEIGDHFFGVPLILQNLHRKHLNFVSLHFSLLYKNWEIHAWWKRMEPTMCLCVFDFFSPGSSSPKTPTIGPHVAFICFILKGPLGLEAIKCYRMGAYLETLGHFSRQSQLTPALLFILQPLDMNGVSDFVVE